MKKKQGLQFLNNERRKNYMYLGLLLRGVFAFGFLIAIIFAFILAIAIADANLFFVKAILFLLVLPLVPIYYYSQKYSQKSARKAMAKDDRQPIFYLRSFKDDGDELSTTFLQRAASLSGFGVSDDFSIEQKLVAIMKRKGPVISCGNPDETMPPIGASRYYVSHSQWKDAVKEMCQKSALVIVRLSLYNTEGVWWETRYVLENVPPNKILFCLPFQNNEILKKLENDNFITYKEIHEASFQKYLDNIGNYCERNLPAIPDGAELLCFSVNRYPIALKMDSPFLESPKRIFLRDGVHLYGKGVQNKDFIKFTRYSNRIFGKIGCIVDRLTPENCSVVMDDPILSVNPLIKSWIYDNENSPSEIFGNSQYVYTALEAPSNWAEFLKFSKSYNRTDESHSLIYLSDLFKVQNQSRLTEFVKRWKGHQRVHRRSIKRLVFIEVKGVDTVSLHYHKRFIRFHFFSRHGRAINYFGGKALRDVFTQFDSSVPASKRIFLGNILIPFLLVMIMAIPPTISKHNTMDSLQTNLLYSDISDTWLGVEWGSSVEEAAVGLTFFNEDKVLISNREPLETMPLADTVEVAGQKMDTGVAFKDNRLVGAILTSDYLPEKKYESISVKFTELYGEVISNTGAEAVWNVNDVSISMKIKRNKSDKSPSVIIITYMHQTEFNK